MSSKTLRRKGNGTFGGQNAGKSFKIKGKQLPSTSVQRLFSAVYRPDTLNSSKSSGGDTVRVRPPLPAPGNTLEGYTFGCVLLFKEEAETAGGRTGGRTAQRFGRKQSGGLFSPTWACSRSSGVATPASGTTKPLDFQGVSPFLPLFFSRFYFSKSASKSASEDTVLDVRQPASPLFARLYALRKDIWRTSVCPLAQLSSPRIAFAESIFAE